MVTSNGLLINNIDEMVMVGKASNELSPSNNVMLLTSNPSSSLSNCFKYQKNTNSSPYSISSPCYTASSSESSISAVPKHHIDHLSNPKNQESHINDTFDDGFIEVCEKVIVDSKEYQKPTPFIKVVELRRKPEANNVDVKKSVDLDKCRINSSKFIELSHFLDDSKRFSLDIKNVTMQKLNSMLNGIKPVANTDENH